MSQGIKRTVFSIAILGESTVGKTKILETYLKRQLDCSNIQTIGIEQYKKQVQLEDGETINIKFWDTAGQERYKSFAFNIIRQCQGIILVYAVNYEYSFTKIKDWIEGIDKYIDRQFTPLILIGNKIDLEKNRVIKKEEGEKFAQDNKLNLFMEASAKTGINAQNIFIQAAKVLYENHLKFKGEEGLDDGEEKIKPMDLSNKKIDDKKKDKGGCC